jgi:thiamine biosynthesis lipoprotein ApbE
MDTRSYRSGRRRKAEYGADYHIKGPAVFPVEQLNDCTADGLTKVMSALPPKEALKFIAQTPDAAVRIVRRPAEKVEVCASKRFRKYYE